MSALVACKQGMRRQTLAVPVLALDVGCFVNHGRLVTWHPSHLPVPTVLVIPPPTDKRSVGV